MLLLQRCHRLNPKSPHNVNQTEFHLIQGVLTVKGLEMRGALHLQDQDLIRIASHFPAFSKGPSIA